ncbi:hypothetical protein C8Q74DRAFT_1216643 [Fomes fomentarius]|nr:hypothetical protein C8Q74DRAFT_1216643 [Fomes fomentarius]
MSPSLPMFDNSNLAATSPTLLVLDNSLGPYFLGTYVALIKQSIEDIVSTVVTVLILETFHTALCIHTCFFYANLKFNSTLLIATSPGPQSLQGFVIVITHIGLTNSDSWAKMEVAPPSCRFCNALAKVWVTFALRVCSGDYHRLYKGYSALDQRINTIINTLIIYVIGTGLLTRNIHTSVLMVLSFILSTMFPDN